MEPQQNPQNDQDSGNNNNKISVGVGVYSSASSSCNRQSSTRWTPTTDQIRILKDLYYNNGVRSPTADQIQRISARLRQYGKIEGKNVFYWFQNHKARERQKKRFSSAADSSSPPMHQRPLSTASWKPLHDDSFHSKYPNFSHGVSSASPSVGGNYGYGSVTMERAFRDCGSSGGGVGGSISHNLGWVGHHVDPYSIFDKRIQLGFEEEEDEEEDQDQHYYDQYQDREAHHHHQQEIETLPLFPMHGEDIKPNFCDATGWYRASGGGGAAHGSSRTSLELSLNSYNGMS